MTSNTGGSNSISGPNPEFQVPEGDFSIPQGDFSIGERDASQRRFKKAQPKGKLGIASDNTQVIDPSSVISKNFREFGEYISPKTLAGVNTEEGIRKSL